MIQTYDPKDTKVFLNGTQLDLDGEVEISYLCKCGEESEYGCHGIQDGEVYSEYHCKKCHNREKKE